MNWNQLLSSKRFGKEDAHTPDAEQRTEFQRDYDRLIFSGPFRRLQNKTQVFPLPGHVFVHNRLTHSLEVSSVGRSLGTDVARRLIEKHPELAQTDVPALGAIVSAACLAHDLGNPPFGHAGERAIRSFFAEGEGRAFKECVSPAVWKDLIHFDGNANTLRLLTHHFQGRRPGGFVMTYTTLASIVKYPYSSDLVQKKPKFGFFEAEREGYERIARELGLTPEAPVPDDPRKRRYPRHPLVYLVEAADDICYEIMDIEDAHKLHLLSSEEACKLFAAFFEKSDWEAFNARYDQCTDVDDRISYYRSCVVGLLERACVDIFLEHEEEILAGTFTGSLISHLPERPLQAYRTCEEVACKRVYRSRGVLDIDLAGYRIIYTLLRLFTEAVHHPERAYSDLLLIQVPSQYEMQAESLEDRLMAVVDYLSGMTDVYALDLYRKIKGHSLPSV